MSDWWNFYTLTDGWEFTSRPPMFAPKDHVLRDEYTRRYEAGELPLDMDYRNYVWLWKQSMDIKKIKQEKSVSEEGKESAAKSLDEMTFQELADFDAYLCQKLFKDQGNLSAWIARYGTCRKMLDIMKEHSGKMANDVITRHTLAALAEKEDQTKH